MDKINKEILVKYFVGNITSEELSELEHWLESDIKNKQAFEKLKATWVISDSQTKYATHGKNEVWRRIKEKSNSFNNSFSSKKTYSLYTALSRAAIIILAIGFGAVLMLISNNYFTSQKLAQNNQNHYNDSILIAAENGSQSEVSLPDGTKVWLNSGSELKFLPTFYTGERVVYLNGEAYFDVTKSKTNHFRVITSDIQIKVLGTEFNVKSYPEEGIIETTLEEGSIVIEKQIGNKVINIATLKPNEKAIFVKKGGKVSINNSDDVIDNKEKTGLEEKLIIKENIDTKLQTAWKDGHLIFKDETFENILIKMERRYDVRINLKNSTLKQLQFTANFKNETIEQALNALQLTHPFKYSFDLINNIITIN